MKKTIDFRRVIILAGTISLGVLYVLLWTRMVTTQAERVGSDYMGLYTAARISQDQGFPFIYNIEYQQEIQRQVVGFEFYENQTSYFTHPPFIVPIVRLSADENYAVSLMRWTIILLLLNTVSVFVLMRAVAQLNFQVHERWLLAAGTFLFWPTFSGLMNGQDVLVLLLGAAIWMVQLLEGKQVLAGLGLSLTVIRPQMALMLSVPFTMRNQKVFLGFVVGGFVFALVSLWLIGSTGFFDYLNILSVVEGGLSYNPHTGDMPGIGGFLRRNLQTVDQTFFRYAIWSGFLAGLAGLTVWWHRQHKITEQPIGLLVLLGLLFVPYAHYHELILLLIPTFCLIRVLSAKQLVSNSNLALLPLIVSLLLLIGFIGPGVMRYIVVYVVMIALGYFLLFPERALRLRALEGRPTS